MCPDVSFSRFRKTDVFQTFLNRATKQFKKVWVFSVRAHNSGMVSLANFWRSSKSAQIVAAAQRQGVCH